jgi:hypothetical protein
MSERPVLVFDSGIGGLSVLREARVIMPGRRFVYVADDAGFPYGRWDEDALNDRIVSLFKGLIERHDPALALIACNTASTIVMPSLRQTYPDLPFVGTVPAIKPAAERTRSGLVSVLATPGTVKRQYTRDLIRDYADTVHVRLVGSENLAELAETYMRKGFVDEAAVKAEIEPCFVDEGRAKDRYRGARLHAFPVPGQPDAQARAVAGGLDRSGRSHCPAGAGNRRDPAGRPRAARCARQRGVHVRRPGLQRSQTDARLRTDRRLRAEAGREILCISRITGGRDGKFC